MKIRNMEIKKQLLLSYVILLFIVFLLGAETFWQASELHKQTDTIYNHPLQVRRALDNLKYETMNMSLQMRNLLLTEDNKDMAVIVENIELSEATAERQFTILWDRYLGPKQDVDEAYHAYVIWKAALTGNLQLVVDGEKEPAWKNLQSGNKVNNLQQQLSDKIKIIDDFAKNKGDTLYLQSKMLYGQVNRITVILMLGMILLAFILFRFVYKNISMPLNELNDASEKIQKGDMTVRSKSTGSNEFGRLGVTFNRMLENISSNVALNEKSAKIAGVMLTTDDERNFFSALLSELAEQTDAQVGAVYLLSEDKKTYENFISIGMDKANKQSYDRDSLEGELGLAVASRRIQVISDIPEDTKYTFTVAGCSFIPRAIIAIPVVTGDEVIGIVTLASIRNFSHQSIELIHDVLLVMSARIEGIINFRKIKDLKDELEKQNMELETQQSELKAQSFELQEQNRELEVQKDQLSEVNRLKTSFLSNMSHELRTPLNSVIALSGVLNRRLDGKIPKEDFSYLEVIERSGKNLLTLINDILDISRIESGRVELDMESFDFRQLLDEIISILQPLAGQKNTEIIKNYPGEAAIVNSDREKCRHILQNVIGNAVKFTESGSVKISLVMGKETVSISVTDTGIGISGENLETIFEEFRQADSSTSRKYGGTGLGLAISKKYTELLGGTIHVSSELNQGSVFTINLPINNNNDSVQPEENPLIEDHVKQTRLSGGNEVSKGAVTEEKTILVVDDSEPAIVQIKDILEESGYTVMVASDGIEALKIIELKTPDAILLDLMMPDMDGFQVLKSIRDEDRTAHVPVLILTAKHITKEELRFLKHNGIQQLIQKGNVDCNALKNAVKDLLNYGKTKEQKPVILLVEDNPDNMMTAKALLQDEYTVIEAVNGEEAVEMAKKHIPHLILMDIALPGIDGIDAFKLIRKSVKLSHIPIIALTASAMTAEKEIMLAYGFDAFISKPIMEDDFLKTIEEVLYGY